MLLMLARGALGGRWVIFRTEKWRIWSVGLGRRVRGWCLGGGENQLLVVLIQNEFITLFQFVLFESFRGQQGLVTAKKSSVQRCEDSEMAFLSFLLRNGTGSRF